MLFKWRVQSQPDQYFECRDLYVVRGPKGWLGKVYVCSLWAVQSGAAANIQSIERAVSLCDILNRLQKSTLDLDTEFSNLLSTQGS